MSDWITLSWDESLSWPKLPGCYVFIMYGRASYVGSTGDLYQRLNNHVTFAHFSASIETPWGTWRDRDITLKVALSKRYGDWLMREARLIKRLRPEFNKRGVPRE